MPNKVYVALDLGSESMAAYYADAFGNGAMINLQAKAPALLGINEDQADNPAIGVDFLEEMNDGNVKPKRSPRMWNRISFNEGVQPQNLEDDHARLPITNQTESDRSLFRYFHQKGGWPPPLIMPNPKILFQHQVKDILPKVEARGGGQVDLSPQKLINHLSLQVIINFVLNSEELKHFNPNDINLTITIPNVYSLPHAESIKKFVEESRLVGEVDVLSESDTVPYQVLNGIDEANDPDDLKKFKRTLDNSRRKRGKLCLVTIDVGKGTTDLSCILFEEPKWDKTSWHRSPKEAQTGTEPEAAKRLKHSVQGKTGKSSGGNYLNYLFASYYDDCLREIADQIYQQTQVKIPFGFLSRSSDIYHWSAQMNAVYQLERLIEEVKRSVAEHYKIELTQERQRELLTPIIENMLDVVQGTPQSKNEFRERVMSELLLPRDLDISGWKKLLPWRKLTQRELRLRSLKQKLQGYVRENVDELLDSLKSLVKEHQAITDKSVEIDKHSFIIVSGQASQFRPLHEAIERKRKAMHIKASQIHFMKGVASKEACCKGVVSYKLAKMWHVNQHELHGTYGCLRANLVEFKPFDMKKIKNGGSDVVTFTADTTYYIVFTPRSIEEVKKSSPVKNDGATALIDVFDGYSFTIHYNRKDLELKVNGRTLELQTFGSSDGSIYKKVWPEILGPAKP